MCTDYLDCDSVLIGPVTPAFPQKNFFIKQQTSKVRFKRLDPRFLEIEDFPFVNTLHARQIPGISGQVA